MERTRKLRRELGYELAKLHALQESVDQTPDDASAKALAAQIRKQAGICLDRLDHYQSSVPTRMWSDGDGKLQPLREDLRRTEMAFRVHAGEWERRAETRSYAHGPLGFIWDEFDEPERDSRGDTALVLDDAPAAPELTSSDARYDGCAPSLEGLDGGIAPFEDDDAPDRGSAVGPLRFTLPMAGGSPEQNMLVLVPCETGLLYEHRYGGVHARHVEIEGFLAPAWANAEAREALDQLFVERLGGNGVGEETRSEALRTLADVIEGIWYGGTDARMTPLRIDEERVDELDHAWVPVLTPDGPAYLAWINSD